MSVDPKPPTKKSDLKVVPLPSIRKNSDDALRMLRESALTDETIALHGIYTEEDGRRISEILGRSWPRLRGGGVMFPLWRPGMTEPFGYQFRPFKPRVDAKGKPTKYESQTGNDGVAFAPRAIANGTFQDPSKPRLLTEGIKKLAAADQLGFAAIAGLGVNRFHDVAHRREKNAYRLHPSLVEHVAWAGSLSLIVFDSDIAEKDEVFSAARVVAGMLIAAGSVPRLVRIPHGPDGKKLGLDDFLALHGEEATRALLATHEAIEPLAVEDPLVPIRDLKPMREAPVQKDLRLPFGFNIDHRGALWETADGEKGRDELVAHGPILIARVLRDLQHGEERLEVVFRREGGWRTAIVERAVLLNARKIVDALTAIGAPVDSGNAAKVVRWLVELEAANEKRLPRTVCVDACGWHDVSGERVFLAPDRLGEGPEVVFDGGNGRSRIVRGLRVAGDVEAHVAALRRAFEVDRIAATVICAAFAAPMLRLVGAPGFAIHLVGDSSRGKSSMLKVAASVYGDPSSEDWVPSWNSTVVGLEQRAATLCDLPFCIDEAGVVDPKERERAVYMLIDGTGRTRGARGGGLRETASWRTIVLSTGEHGLVDEEANTGAQVRVLQFRVDGFGTLDAAGVDALRGACAENFGAVGRFWLSELLELDAAETREGFRAYVKAARTRVNGQGLRARQAEYIALLGFVEGYVHRMMGIGDPNGATMLSWLDEPEGQSARRAVVSVAERALALVQDWFSGSRASFADIEIALDGRREAKATGGRELYGYVDRECVAVIPTALRSYLGKHGVDWQVVGEWNRRGWLLVNERERGTWKTVLNSQRIRTVAFRRDVLLDLEDRVSHGTSPKS